MVSSVAGAPASPAAEPPAAASPPDPHQLIRSRAYIVALVLAAVIGFFVSAVAYWYLALVSWLQKFVFTQLPGHLGFSTVPSWWVLPPLALSGLLVALCIKYLPGNCGHSPAEGFKTSGPPTIIELPGVILASLATLSLGAVLGPEAPLIAIGGGLGALALRLLKRDAAPSATALIAAAGSFAAISTLLGSPLLGAFLLMEAAGLSGMMLAVSLLPGLLAAGIGSLVFVGLDSWTGRGTFSLAIPDLPPFSTPTLAMFAWAIVVGLLAPILAWLIYTGARLLRPLVHANRVPVTVLLGLAVAGCAIVFFEITGKGTDEVLFSGQSELPALITQASSWSIGAVIVLIIAKTVAYALSLSAFRGGPVFPSMFIGGAIGVLTSHLPGMSIVPAVGIGIGAMCASMLKLPFTSVLLATVLLTSDGYAVMPVVIVAVVVAYVTTQWLPPIAPLRERPGLGRPTRSPQPDDAAQSAAPLE